MASAGNISAKRHLEILRASKAFKGNSLLQEALRTLRKSCEGRLCPLHCIHAGVWTQALPGLSGTLLHSYLAGCSDPTAPKLHGC